MPVTTRRSGPNGSTSNDSPKPPVRASTKRAAEDPPECRPVKRTKAKASSSKAPRKKRVGNENESMMTLPIEIFMHVLGYVTPCALVALIRTNKTFRRILLAPSARPIWQAAEDRAPSLPSCPSWMSEPRYAALLFSNLCTTYSAVTTLKLDTHLFVRLCASCRKTELVDYDAARQAPLTAYMHLLSWSNTINPKTSRSCALRHEVDQMRQEFTQHSNFRRQLDEHVNTREKEHQEEMDALKKQRRQLIYKRLRVLGWTDEDFEFDDAGVKPWKALVHVPQLLSDKGVVFNANSKVNRTTGENRKQKELQARYRRTWELLAEYERDAHPFKTMLDNIGQANSPLVANPFPDIATTALGWENVKELYEQDTSIEAVETRFTERLPSLETLLATWRTETELQLVRNLDLERKPSSKTVLKIRGSTELTRRLSPQTRFLLRADTIFKAPLTEPNQSNQWYYPGPHSSRPGIRSLYYYPDLLLSPGSTQSSEVKVDLSRFTRHREAERVAKSLLSNLGMTDVAYMELKAAGAGFRSVQVEHYREMNEKWEKEARYQREQQTKHKITFINAHDLETTADSSKPLLELELVQDGRKSLDGNQSEVECKLCLVGWRSTTYCSMRGIAEHMKNVHGISEESVKGLHYGARTQTVATLQFKNDWRKRWDAHHDQVAT
ncbi:hypothetical protein FRC07_007716 [Ceratobasidium sp. 392]|nr:hypothetical protein FRC07_007716 [Ceratobasidium sp. 392]